MTSRQQDHAWAAGFLDGEGCIDLKKNRASYTPRVRVTQVCRDPLDRLVELFGGKIYPKKESHGKDSWEWQLLGMEVFYVLGSCVDQMSVKWQEAALLNAAMWAFEHKNLSGIKIQAAIADRLRELKREVGADTNHSAQCTVETPAQ